MKNTLGENFCVTIFGESHGPYIGVVLDGIAPGIDVNKDFINHQLDLRRPSGKISTKRVETDEFILASGVFNDKTTGTPLTILIPNSVQHSKDYEKTATLARPGHADYTANVKYHGFQDFRGGGHFSGRITAALVAAGGIIIPELEKITFTEDNLHQEILKSSERLELKSGVVYTVLRVALTSYNVTPGGSVEMADILGKEESLRRLNMSLNWLK